MRIKNAIFFWIPNTSNFRILERPEVIPNGGMTTGAVFADWHKMSDQEKVLNTFSNALAAICRDGVSPAAVAKALVTVDELREMLPEDFLSVNTRSEALNAQ